jgi:hypothetical protein
MYLIIGCIMVAMQGDFMPPGADDAQHGMAIIQSIMQFIGQSMQAQPMHGFMHGSMHAMGHFKQEFILATKTRG